MNTLREIGWPHLVPRRPDLSTSASESSVTRSVTNRPRQFSAGHSESENTFADPSDHNSAAPLLNKERIEHGDNGGQSPPLSIASEVLAEAYLGLHPPPETPGEDIGQDINPHLPPSPGVINQVDTCAISNNLPPLPNSPTPEDPIDPFLASEQDLMDKAVKSELKHYIPSVSILTCYS